MTAKASPINPPPPGTPDARPAKVPVQGGHFGTDAVYKGYDLMVRRFATHIIRDARVNASNRADLVRAISSPFVTFAASAADGSILISCPDGLPEILSDLAEPLDTAIAEPLGKLAQKLDHLTQKLDTLIQDHALAESLSDRVEMLEFTLHEKLDPATEMTRVTQGRLDQIDGRMAAIFQAVTQIPAPVSLDTFGLELAVAAAEGRLLAAITAPAMEPDLSPVLESLQGVSNRIDSLPEAHGMLARLCAQLDDLSNRAVPIPDMSGHHQALTAAEVALSGLAARLDRAVDRLPDPHTLAIQGQTLATIAMRFAETPAELERILTRHLDFAPLVAGLHTLETAVGQTAQGNVTAGALGNIGLQITALAERPQPIMDLGAQNRGLAEINAALSEMGQQVAVLTQITAAGPNLAPLVMQYDSLLATLGLPAQSTVVTAALTAIGTELARLAARPEPVMDLTEQTKSLGDIAAALAGLTARHDGLISVIGQPAQSADMTAALTEFGTEITRLAQRPEPVMDLTEQNRGLTQIATALKAMAQQLDHLTSVTMAGPGLSGLAVQLADLHAALGSPAQSGDMAAALDMLAGDLASLAARPDMGPDLSVRLEGLARSLATGPQIAAQFDKILMTLGQPAQASVLAEDLAALAGQIMHLVTDAQPDADPTDPTQTLYDIAAQLPTITQRLDSMAEGLASAPALALLSDQIQAGLARLDPAVQFQTIPSTVTALATQIASLADRADPVIDMTGMQDSFAQFGTALGHAVQRLETTAQMLAHAPDLTPLLAPILMQLDSLRIDLAVPVPDIGTATALLELTTQITILAQRDDRSVPPTDQDQSILGRCILAELGGLADQIAGLAHDLADAPDLLGPVQQFGATLLAAIQMGPHPSLTGGIADLSAQLADLAARPAPPLDLTLQRQDFAGFTTTLSEVVLRLEDVARQVADSDPSGIAERVAAMQSDLLVQRQDMTVHHALAGLAQQVAGLLDRPDMSADIGAQNQHLVDFAQAIDALVQWLGPLAHDLATGPDFGPILAEFDLLRGALNQPGRDAALDQGFAHLADRITDLANHVTDLATSPDDLVGLAEQRRSFSSFSNALAFMLQRLDAWGPGPAGAAPSPEMTHRTAEADDPLTQQLLISGGTKPTTAHRLHNPAATSPGVVLWLDRLIDKIGPRGGAADPFEPDAEFWQPLADQPNDPAQLSDKLDRATMALAQVVHLLEQDGAGLPLADAASASVPQLFDRLDAALMARDGCGLPDSELTKAIANLSRSIPGRTNHGADLPDLGQGMAGLQHLRIDYAELVARNLQMLAETA